MRACISDLEHANGLHERSSEWPSMRAWLESQPSDVQLLAAEFNYGLRLNFNDGVRWVVGYASRKCGCDPALVLLVAPICPQCYGTEKAIDHPGVSMMDPAKVRAGIKKQ